MDIRREVLRNSVLCQALAPLGQRLRVAGGESGMSGPKAEHFVIAGVNSGWPFYDLADRVLAAGRQPECIYDLAYEAQQASIRGRLGGKVNYGQIFLMIPLVTAQVLEFMDSGAADDVEAILERTGEVLRATTPKDLEMCERFIHLGHRITVEQLGTARSSAFVRPDLVGRYASMWSAMQDYQQIQNVRELVRGYPDSRHVYSFLLHNVEEGMLEASAMIARMLYDQIGSAELVADRLAVGLYLVLTRHPESVLFV